MIRLVIYVYVKARYDVDDIQTNIPINPYRPAHNIYTSIK
jgi:hypothetical protein